MITNQFAVSRHSSYLLDRAAAVLSGHKTISLIRPCRSGAAFDASGKRLAPIFTFECQPHRAAACNALKIDDSPSICPQPRNITIGLNCNDPAGNWIIPRFGKHRESNLQIDGRILNGNWGRIGDGNFRLIFIKVCGIRITLIFGIGL